MTKKTKVSQKDSRGPTQRAADSRSKSIAARRARIASHNDWPSITATDAELKFKKLLDDNPEVRVLKPYGFKNIDDNDFHRHLGMLIDGLEMLPMRPDHAFDFFFRAADELSQLITKKTKITDAVEALGPHVCGSLASKETWRYFTNLFSENLPITTAKFMAQRILSAYGAPKDPVRPRAERLFSQNRYREIHQKFFGSRIEEGEEGLAKGANDAGIFLKHLVGKRTTIISARSDDSFPLLDLKNPKNIFDEPRALSTLMSLAAFTSRNERFHGSSLSPFRSSKASLKTYASYYFEMLFLYTLVVGLMIELFDDCGDVNSWKDDMDENIQRLQVIFGNSIK